MEEEIEEEIEDEAISFIEVDALPDDIKIITVVPVVDEVIVKNQPHLISCPFTLEGPGIPII
jgi:hypothetical protein